MPSTNYRRGVPKERHFTMILVPPRAPATSYRISYPLLRMGLAGLLVGALLMSFVVKDRRFLLSHMDELYTLRSLTSEQQVRIRDLSQQAEALMERLKMLEALDSQIREWLKNQSALPDSRLSEVDQAPADVRVSSLSFRGGPRLLDLPDSTGGEHLDYITLMLRAIQQQLAQRETSLDQLQGLAVEAVDYLRARPSVWPVAGRVTSHYGMRRSPLTGLFTMHNGIDIGAALGTAIVATGDAVVEFVGYSSGLGRHIILDHGYGIKTVYAHNQRNLVSPGDLVKRGQVIAQVGNTGASTGPHLHYEIIINGRRVDPWLYHLSDQVPGGR
ncbi:MAG: M23 family metallopeptidase [Bacillota bacterium]